MIKIIRGVYGFVENGRVVPKGISDEPFSCDKKEEKRLVDLGIAEFVKDEAKKESKPAVDRQALIAKFKELKLSGNPAQKSNDALIEAIAAAEEALANGGKDDEDGAGDEDNSGDEADVPGEDENAGDGEDGDDGEDTPDLSGEDGVND